MAIDFRADKDVLHDHLLKQMHVVFQVSITASATPADKVHASDLPGIAVLRTEGKTATADAIEDLSSTFSTADDGTGVFGILIDDAIAKKFHIASVTPSSGTIDVTKGISSEGRPYLDLDSSVDLSAASLTLVCELVYMK